MVDTPNDILKPRIKYTPKPKVDPNLLLHAEDLLSYYSFDLGQQSAAILLRKWAETYPVQWIRLAIIEALYQGRYKTISVAQILQLWGRRKQVQTRFDQDFEKLICEKLPRKLILQNPDNEASEIAALAAEIHASEKIKTSKLEVSSAEDTADQNNGKVSSSDSNHSAGQEAALAALARVVQNRKSMQPSVNAVINHVEANVETVAEQAKQQVLSEVSRSLSESRVDNFEVNHYIADVNDLDSILENDKVEVVEPIQMAIDKSIHQFTPNPLSPELLAKLKAVSTEQKTS